MQCCGGLFFIYKATENRHIEKLVLAYLKKHNGATKNELIAHINKKIGEKANVNLSLIVDEIIEKLKIKDLVFIEKGMAQTLDFALYLKKTGQTDAVTLDGMSTKLKVCLKPPPYYNDEVYFPCRFLPWDRCFKIYLFDRYQQHPRLAATEFLGQNTVLLGIIMYLYNSQ